MRPITSLLFVLGLGACERPSSLVICHNSNCVDPHDRAPDDTLGALQASLALDVDGRPPFDGIELDLFWDQGRCLFAHDIAHVGTAVDAMEPAIVLAEYLRTNATVAAGQRFVLLLELKTQAGEPDRASHAACALQVATTVIAAALDGAHDLDVIIDANDADLLRAFAAQAGVPASDEHVRIRLAADFGIPPPVSYENGTLASYEGLELDIATIHTSWTTNASLRAVREMDLDLAVWMFDATTETLNGIAAVDPAYIVTGQVRLVRQWLQY